MWNHIIKWKHDTCIFLFQVSCASKSLHVLYLQGSIHQQLHRNPWLMIFQIKHILMVNQHEDCVIFFVEFPIAPEIALELLMAANFLDC